jgi:hypothetical protein
MDRHHAVEFLETVKRSKQELKRVTQAIAAISVNVLIEEGAS